MGRALTVYTNDRVVIFKDEDDKEHKAVIKSTGHLQVSVGDTVVGLFNVDCWSHFTVTEDTKDDD